MNDPIRRLEDLEDSSNIWDRLLINMRFFVSRSSPKRNLGAEETILAARLLVAGHSYREIGKSLGVNIRIVEYTKQTLHRVMMVSLTKKEKKLIDLQEEELNPYENLIVERITNYRPLFEILNSDKDLAQKAQDHPDFTDVIQYISLGYSFHDIIRFFGVGRHFSDEQAHGVENLFALSFLPYRQKNKEKIYFNKNFFTRLALARLFAPKRFNIFINHKEISDKLNKTMRRIVLLESLNNSRMLGSSRSLIKLFPLIEPMISKKAAKIDSRLPDSSEEICKYLDIYQGLEMTPVPAALILVERLNGKSSSEIARMLRQKGVPRSFSTLKRYIFSFVNTMENSLIKPRLNALSPDDFKKEISRNRSAEIVKLQELLLNAKREQGRDCKISPPYQPNLAV